MMMENGESLFLKQKKIFHNFAEERFDKMLELNEKINSND